MVTNGKNTEIYKRIIEYIKIVMFATILFFGGSLLFPFVVFFQTGNQEEVQSPEFNEMYKKYFFWGFIIAGFIYGIAIVIYLEIKRIKSKKS